MDSLDQKHHHLAWFQQLKHEKMMAAIVIHLGPTNINAHAVSEVGFLFVFDWKSFIANS